MDPRVKPEDDDFLLYTQTLNKTHAGKPGFDKLIISYIRQASGRELVKLRGFEKFIG
jgi:hypothetical protein